VSGKPDLLTISLGVQVQGNTASAALEDANGRTAALIDTLKKAGVADVDITTADVSLNPRYDRDGVQITGYQAGNSVRVKLRDLTKAGAVIDAAAGSVGDAIRMNGLAFSIEDSGPLYAQARDLAVKQAQAQAQQLAKSAGVQLGSVLTISENTQQYTPPMPYAASAAGARDASVPIEAGSQTLQLSVQLVYSITG
jgi:uncharacterized protein YggE